MYHTVGAVIIHYICRRNIIFPWLIWIAQNLNKFGISQLTTHEIKAQQTRHYMQEVGQKWSNTVGIGPIPAHFLHSMAYVPRD